MHGEPEGVENLSPLIPCLCFRDQYLVAKVSKTRVAILFIAVLGARGTRSQRQREFPKKGSKSKGAAASYSAKIKNAPSGGMGPPTKRGLLGRAETGSSAQI